MAVPCLCAFGEAQANTDDGAAIKNGLPDDNHLINANVGTPPDGRAPVMQMYLTGSESGGILQGNWGGDAATVLAHEKVLKDTPRKDGAVVLDPPHCRPSARARRRRAQAGTPTATTGRSLLTWAMELSPAPSSFAHKAIWKVFAHRGMGYFAAALSSDHAQPDEDFSLPPGPATLRVTLTGKVSDDTTGTPLSGVTVSVSGHNSGVPEGTYRKVYASGNGYAPKVGTVQVETGSADADWSLIRDWAASSGGAAITDFNGSDASDFGCGPGSLIDTSSAVWGSDAIGGTNGTGVDPIHGTVKLPKAVDIGELLIDPTAGCGDDTTASLGDYRIDTSTDGTGQNIQYVRLRMLGNQAADNGVDCAKDAGPSGCRYLDVTELAVHGTAHQG